MRSKINEHMRLLLIDDERVILDSLRNALEGPDVSIDIAETLDRGVALLQRRFYHCVVTDVALTGRGSEEGLVILKYVKDHKPDTKVVVMTGNGRTDINFRAYTLGADMFMEKPVGAEELQGAISGLLGRNGRG